MDTPPDRTPLPSFLICALCSLACSLCAFFVLFFLPPVCPFYTLCMSTLFVLVLPCLLYLCSFRSVPSSVFTICAFFFLCLVSVPLYLCSLCYMKYKNSVPVDNVSTVHFVFIRSGTLLFSLFPCLSLCFFLLSLSFLFLFLLFVCLVFLDFCIPQCLCLPWLLSFFLFSVSSLLSVLTSIFVYILSVLTFPSCVVLLSFVPCCPLTFSLVHVVVSVLVLFLLYLILGCHFLSFSVFNLVRLLFGLIYKCTGLGLRGLAMVRV